MTRRTRIDDLLALTVPSQPALSPDRLSVAYVLAGHDEDADSATSAIWLTQVGGSARPITNGTTDASPAFSPDGRTLAFLRDGQVWTLPVGGGEAKQRTTLPGGAGAPVWSPDGARIAFAALVDAVASPSENGEEQELRSSDPIVIDELGYQADGFGYFRAVRAQIYILDVETGRVRQLTDGTAHAGTPAWAPDGSAIVFTATPADADDLDARSAVHLKDSNDPAAAARIVAFSFGVATAVTFAPDGAHLLVVGWTGQPVGPASLHRVALDTGQSIVLGASLDRNVMPGAPAYPGALPQVTENGDVLFAVRDRGCTHLYSVPLVGGSPRLVRGGDGNVVSGVSVVGSVAAIAVTTPSSFGEIAVIDLDTGAEVTVTEHGAAPYGAELYVREPREFSISDGSTVQGWILRDKDTTGASPLLLDIHGGPHNAWNGAADETHLYHQELVSRGWTVLTLNPRGSDGYGKDFWLGATGAWGEADACDFLEPIDALVSEGIADPARLAVTGYSYGGFMTTYLTGHDDRFAAAVPGGLVSDLTSQGGTSDEARSINVFELGASPWNAVDRERLVALSPYTNVDRVSTPTLVLHGGSDLRCPIGQAQQWHYALQERGVPTRLVVYPGASHTFPITGKPSHRTHYGHQLTEWVDRYAGDSSGVRPEKIDAEHWQRRLSVLAERHKLPGAQLGILRMTNGADDELVTAATGTLNKNIATGAPVTADSLFQIGSITKVWTATVVMKLIDDGKLSLETRVADLIPGFRLIDDTTTSQLTVRHLLIHTSGIDGDIFTDTGRGDDCIEKYVATLDTAGRNHPIGVTWSYCNSGYTVLGRIIEVVTGQTWDDAMRDLLYSPLGLTHTVTLPEDAIRFAPAVGHFGVDDEQTVSPVWIMPRALGPAGLIDARAADVLAFARMHLGGGVTANGTRVLSDDSAEQMQAFQVEVPDKHILGDSWGLGWIRFDWNGERLYGHDGNTHGQAAYLRIHPGSGVAVVLLTNGGNAHDLYEDIYREIFQELSDVDMKHPVEPPIEPVEIDGTPFIGTYERSSVRIEVLPDGKALRLRTTTLGEIAEVNPDDAVEEYPMVALGDNLFAVRPAGTQTWITATFYSLPTGEPYVHFGGRATPKIVASV